VRRLVWSASCRQDVREIITYIASDNPRAAAQVRERINQTANQLAAMPTGRRGRVAGTYEKILPGLPYIIACALETTPAGEEVLVVLRVIHGARQWPQKGWPSP
jgi:toxin ParE1/3/4